MIVQYKMIENERVQDAPFVGALICAPMCKNHCKECFNQPLKELPNIIEDSQLVIDKVKSNPFNKGIILAGLEWSCFPDELIEMVKCAKKNDLEVMVYTGLTEDIFTILVNPDELEGVYVKFGPYIPNKPSVVSYGVTLASDNQYIKYFGGEADVKKKME